jgi:hypothetical protein
MTLITDQSTLFSFSYLVGYTGQASGSFGNQDLTNIINSVTYVPVTSAALLNSIAKVTTTFNIYYKIQGYNTSTLQYENWHSMGTPLMVPPSGNTLVDISVIATWTDR